eukprot:scaffold281977_cov22-Tisochrysis_lutea.AAC.1
MWLFHKCDTTFRTSSEANSSLSMRISYVRPDLYPTTSKVPTTGWWSEAPFPVRSAGCGPMVCQLMLEHVIMDNGCVYSIYSRRMDGSRESGE